MEKSKIAVIIVSFNGKSYLGDCLRCLEEQTLAPEKVIVIDNNSKDGSVEFLKEYSLKTELNLEFIFSKENLGFTGGNNLGMKKALEEKMDYIFLLNQDTEMEKDTLGKLLEAADREKDLFCLQPLILFADRKDVVQTAGDRIHFLGFGYLGDYLVRLEDFKKKIKRREEIPYASGAAMFIVSDALREVGFFDEDYFLYHEDMDLCLRARILKKKILLVPQAFVYHKYKSGITPLKWSYSERNRHLMLLKFYKLPTLFLIFPYWFAAEIGSLIFSISIRALNSKIKGYFEIFSLLPKFLKKRKEIQKIRKIKDKELVSCFDGEFKFVGFHFPLFFVINPILGSCWKALRGIIFW